MTSTLDISDSRLVALGKAGDATALNQLALRYWREAIRVAMRIVRSHADAEDVAQDALWSAFTHLTSYRGEASFRSWLHSIVVNQSLIVLRRRRTRTLLLVPSVTAVLETPEDLLLQAERKALVDRHLNALPKDYISVLRLATLEEKSVAEIAETLGITAAATKTRLHRARMQLLKKEAQSKLTATGPSDVNFHPAL